ncbi:hypothetical protein C2845_PM04G24570 [Panicum miliaceum]|uniref:Charged multivesicular body protein 3 n=1 Tax=Panicum miliaceum TaxID=4540 RepID=A0A3L6QS75_PANMI|nr:hypothetical protein C2845_PM04G24570 [Panicum miliaceum]
MEMLKGLLQPRPTPRQQLREWQGRLRNERLGLDRRVQEVRREDKKVENAIREAAKRNDMASAKFIRILLSGLILKCLSSGIERTADCLSKSAEVMKIINDLMEAPELAHTIKKLSKEMLKAEVMEDMVNETVDSALDFEDEEDDIEEEVDKVLAALGAETASRLPVPAAQRIKKDSMSRVPGQLQTVDEGIEDDQEDLEEENKAC